MAPPPFAPPVPPLGLGQGGPMDPMQGGQGGQGGPPQPSPAQAHATELKVKPIPLPAEGKGSYTYWKKEVDASVERLTQFKPEWDRNVMSYRAKPLTKMPHEDAVVVPRDFALVEQKAAQLFFRTPEVRLTTRIKAVQDPVQVFQDILNYYLSEDEAGSMAMMNETLFDALCPAGILCSVIGYETFVDGVQRPPTGNMIPDPKWKPTLPPGDILGLSGSMDQPPLIPELMPPVPNVVYARYFWNRFSPAAAIIPQDFGGSDYDKAAFLGYRFKGPWSHIKTVHQLGDMDIPRSKGTNTSDLKIKSEPNMDSSNITDPDEVSGWCIWYRTSLYDSKQVHPEKFRQLICLDGLDAPLVHRDSPFQRDVAGKLVGLMGNPIHLGALRYVSDSAYPPSECSISRASNEELNKSRTQMMLQRDRSIPMRLADIARLGGADQLEKLRQNQYQSIIGLPSFDPNKPPIAAIQLSSFPRENFTFNDYLDSDIGQTWAMGANQRGLESANSITATESAKIDQWATTRLDKERAKALEYYMKGVRKFGAILQLFLTDEQAAAIVGQEEAGRLSKWDRKSMPAPLSYTCDPDSAIRRDPVQVRVEALKLYELTAKDPHANSPELLADVMRAFSRDPIKLVTQQTPPSVKPAALSFRFDTQSIDVRNPNFPIYLAILKQNGYQSLEEPVVDPATGEKEPSPVEQALAYSQFQQQLMGVATGGEPPTGIGFGDDGEGGGEGVPTMTGGPKPQHGGSAPRAERLSKHQGDAPGGLPGNAPE